MSFTPGPWRAERTLGEWAITGPPNYDEDSIVVWADAGVNGKANARLIAAAPDMHAALTQVSTILHRRNQPGWEEELLAVVDAALSKAEVQ
jgi:hypothetical protein